MTASRVGSARTSVAVDRLVDGDDAWLAGDPAAWLPEPARRAGPDRWSVVLSAGPLSQEVSCRVGAVWRRQPWAARALSWHPASDPDTLLPVEALLPSFDGALRWSSSPAGGLVLQITGSYAPPGRLVGRALDDAVLHRVAEGTLRAFLDAIAERAPESAPADVTPPREAASPPG